MVYEMIIELECVEKGNIFRGFCKGIVFAESVALAKSRATSVLHAQGYSVLEIDEVLPITAEMAMDYDDETRTVLQEVYRDKGAVFSDVDSY